MIAAYEPSAFEGAYRQSETVTRTRRAVTVTRVMDAVLALLPTRDEWTLAELARQVKAPHGILTQAIAELTEQGRAHFSDPGKGRYRYRAVLQRDPSRAPRLHPGHDQVVRYVRRHRVATIPELMGALHLTQPRALTLVFDLYHAGKLNLRAVGNTVVVRCAP